jgi:hypothetical protein
MGGKLRSANHCIIGEMFVLKRLLFSSIFWKLNNTRATIPSEDENPVLSSSAKEKVAEKEKKLERFMTEEKRRK